MAYPALLVKDVSGRSIGRGLLFLSVRSFAASLFRFLAREFKLGLFSLLNLLLWRLICYFRLRIRLWLLFELLSIRRIYRFQKRLLVH